MNLTCETLSVALADGVVTVELNRPDKANAMNHEMWQDIRSAFRWVGEPEARVAVIAGRGRSFHFRHRSHHARRIDATRRR